MKHYYNRIPPISLDNVTAEDTDVSQREREDGCHGNS